MKNVMVSFIEKNQATLTLLDQAGQMEYCHWPKKREQLWLANEHLTDIKDTAKLLQVRTLYLAEEKSLERLYESLKTSIAYGKSFHQQASLLDHLIRLAVRNLARESLNEALNRIAFDEQQLTYLQREFSDMQGFDDLYQALIIDRVCTIEFWKLPYKERGKDGIYSPPPFLKFLNSASGMIKKDANLSLDYLEGYLAAAQLPLWQRVAAFSKIEARKDSLSSLHVHLKYSASIAAVNSIDMRVLGQYRCAEAALAVERYRLKYGALPASLEALVPAFMAAVPLEPFDGEPLRYVRHEDGGYTVYTIGDDWVDNGGLSREQMAEQTGQANPEEFDWPFTVKR